MQNYFNYYTEIEEHFQRRRGTLLVLSTLDWALIASWQEAGYPLQAVLAGIDATFDKYAARQTKGHVRHVNGLAYCAQEVIHAMERMHAAATGTIRDASQTQQDTGFEVDRIQTYLRSVAKEMNDAMPPAAASSIVVESIGKLLSLADSVSTGTVSLESIEKQLLAAEDQIFAALQTFTSTEDLTKLREQSTSELAPYKGKLQAMQIRQIEQQFLRRTLFDRYAMPRMSLFYMRQT